MTEDTLMTVDITGLAHGGDGVGHLPDGRVVFVPRALPTESVRVRLIQSKKSFARAELVDVLVPHVDRIDSACSAFESCGGCAFWMIPYATEFELKTQATLEAMRRICGWDQTPTTHLYPASIDRGYRERATVHARKLKTGVILGFYARGSRRITDLTSCPALHPELEPALIKLREHIAPKRSAVADILIETDGDGGWTATGDTSLKPGTICASSAVHGADDTHRLPAGRFRQSGRATNANLVAALKECIAPTATILELFAGMGNLTHTLRQTPGLERILGIESDTQAVDAARELSTGPEVSFEVANLPDNLSDLRDRGPWETVVLDPPRTGAREVCEAIATWTETSRIVYVSCEATRAARDIAHLESCGWNTTHLHVVDLFPKTPHVEVIATLVRK